MPETSLGYTMQQP